MKKYINFLESKGADKAVIIETKSVVTAPWTAYKCKFGCKAYGNNLCCPPNTPTYRETQDILNCYTKGILFRTHEINTVTPLAVETAREMFLDNFYKVIAFGDGDCGKCSKCNSEHCNFPGQTVPSMEACGIDVFATVRANGLEIRVLREKGEMQNHFGLILYE
ncbi:MAG: DUF2284 domain-containing protein [Eubacteriales bacterium]|nr:DUF2284 domain-containing protein [Eubacteriales bacterium]